MSTLRRHGSTLALLTLVAGCQYDLDKIYEYTEVDAGNQGGDAGDGKDAAPNLVSQHLIGLWGSYPTVDRECVECAESMCAQAEAECRADADCVAYTQCVAATPTPVGQAACRVRYASWVNSGDVRARDLTGPYGQCVFRDNCAAQCDGNADLSCVGNFGWPTTAESSIPLTLYLTDAIDQTKFVAGVRVKVCKPDDAACTSPQSQGTTDDKGMVMLALPPLLSRSFTGYLEITGQDLFPTLLKFGWNIATPTTQVISVVNKDTFTSSIEFISGLKLDQTRGMLQLRLLGCNGVGVKGASFTASSADGKTRYWYIDNGLPKLDATETNVLGAGGVIDVPVGATSITGTRASDHMVVSRADALVRANFMTVVIMAPLSTQ